ncbi:MAG TPA: flagellin [Pyrinomonadaceae bacterium]|nr:flagellin [Pyrinomonadaceae bacterium]
MSISLVNNLSSLESQSRLNVTGAKLNQTIQRLSTGLRINNSGDDAAGLAVANKYRSDVAILSQGVRNANDGMSALQIIDGGLNTISGLLDRAATLAAQSASDTFTGDRNTLNSEFGKVVSEISRESQNIGLDKGGVNNTALTTIIGGGSNTFAAAGTNQGVQIDLSGNSNAVDATSLGLSQLNIGATSGTTTASGGIDFRSSSAVITAAETLTFQYVGATGSLATTTVSLGAGQSANSVLAQLQADTGLKTAGITAGIDASGNLQFSSANFFTTKSSLAAASQTGIGTSTLVTGAANSVSLTGLAAGAGASQTMDFTIGASGTIVQQTYTSSTTAATSAANIAAAINGNATLRDAGIFAINDAASTGVKVVSTKTSFSFNAENAAAAANNGVAAGVGTYVAGTGTGGAQGAKSALDAIKTAVASLGKVQGTVGAGQNRLQQAIDLATTQITNFQAAQSRVRDADVAAEASNMSRLNVLQQAGVAALAQANQASQAVLSLLR